MGYSHYWYHKRDFTQPEWTKVKSIAAALFEVCKQNGVVLTDPMGVYRSKPVIDDEMIGFNGNPDCESMLLDRVPPEEEKRRHAAHRDSMLNWQGAGPVDETTICFACCKTRKLPYDIAVVALLAAVDMVIPGALKLESDGEPEIELVRGVELARRLLSKLIPGETFTCSLDAPPLAIAS